ncbi:MAG TPA: radical SAM/SPASM domain-containing protein [Candidatus Wunengus sp. YC63]|uniref:radical SAM/SPASM domain-containing protein n=1 Tax=unclassified Candidatus Wunengus TaxID=3367695 RepID=UPI0040275288
MSTIKKIYSSILPGIYTFLGKTRLPYYPSKISIESGNLCNLRCPLCPTGQQDKSAKKGFISFDIFKKIVDEMGQYLTVIRLYNWGEPMLNKDFLRMVHYAKERGINIKISTNLSMRMEDDQIEALVKGGLEKIYISCNGASSETYLKYHVGGDFDLVMDNMKRLVQKKREIPGCHTKLVWLFHVFKHNEHEIAAAKELAKKIGVKIKISKMRPDMGKEVFETTQRALERDRAWMPDNPEFTVVSTKQKKRIGCMLPWTETMINWDGSVLPCCAVYSEKYAFGNILENSFKEIWNNDMYVAARKEILGIKNDRQTICHICKSSGYLHGG